MTVLAAFWFGVLVGIGVGAGVTLLSVAAFMMYVANKTGAKAGD